jgi:hypothetical protein
MRGHFRKATDDGQVRPKHIVPFSHILLYNNNNNNNNRMCDRGIIYTFISNTKSFQARTSIVTKKLQMKPTHLHFSQR